MWTEEHRAIYRRDGKGFPSDLRDAEWVRLEPLIPRGAPGRRPRQPDIGAAMTAIVSLLRTGCPWRYLPRDGFPPRSTVYNIFRKFQKEGVWDAIWDELHMGTSKNIRLRRGDRLLRSLRCRLMGAGLSSRLFEAATRAIGRRFSQPTHAPVQRRAPVHVATFAILSRMMKRRML